MTLNFCPECEEIEEEPTTSYECGECGNIFTLEDVGSHRCEDCGRFASKLSNNACTGCGTDLEETPEELDGQDNS